ncbi:MAG: hypothetical protein K2J76_00225, partial [Oscillospiraceae bacterium]|nr:hypothetical protein [Oscillospiraceae bacterium]
ILFLALLTACNSGQSIQTSETVSETETSAVTTAAETKMETTTSIITTTAMEMETETEKETVPAEDDIAFEAKLVSALADIIEQHNGYNFFMCDFNLDGCPEIVFYGYDMLTAYFNIYDFSSGEPVLMGTAIPGECSQNTDINCCCELYFYEKSGEYVYASLSRYADSLGTLTDHYFQDMYITKLRRDMKFNDDNDLCDSYMGISEEEWYAERDKAQASLSEYALIEHINPDNFKTYTIYDPSPYDPSPIELANIVLKDYYMGE